MTQLQDLAKPFPASAIRTRPQGGREVEYVPASTVIEKLLATLGPFGWHVSATGRDPWVIVGTITAEVDGRTVEVQGVGEGDDAKSAESDALKRAARMLAVGLHLWSGDGYRLHRALEHRPTVIVEASDG